MNATVTRAGRQVKTMCVSDVAQQCNVRADTVRYYARIGLVRPNRKSNGYRQFGGPDIQRLNFIHRARNLGCTLGEIRKILEFSNSGKSPCPVAREILERRIKENRKRLKTQLSLQRRMERALEVWASMRDGVPNGESVCRLIEALGSRSWVSGFPRRRKRTPTTRLINVGTIQTEQRMIEHRVSRAGREATGTAITRRLASALRFESEGGTAVGHWRLDTARAPTTWEPLGTSTDRWLGTRPVVANAGAVAVLWSRCLAIPSARGAASALGRPALVAWMLREARGASGPCDRLAGELVHGGRRR